MTDIVTASSNKLDNWSDSGPWYEGTHGERIEVRVSSLDTNGAYAVVESIAAPGCATPMHLHRNEAEHFVIIAGSYRIAIGEKIYEASAGASIILPKGVPHSWRNISSEPGRMVVILTPGGSSNVSRPSATTLPNSLRRSLHLMAATSSDRRSAHSERQHRPATHALDRRSVRRNS